MLDLPPALTKLLETAALNAFETPSSYLALLLNGLIPVRATRYRIGGKPKAAKLLRGVDPHCKRGQVLAFLLTGATVSEAMYRPYRSPVD
jgi:hypothetical protein